MKILIVSFLLLIALLLGLSVLQASGNSYNVHYYYSGGETYLVAVGDNGGVGICKR